jgi:hypothetical protein
MDIICALEKRPMCIKHLQMDSGAKNSLVLRVTMTNEDTI